MSAEINNVVLFVSDSLRWDYLPKGIASKGTVFKTVAQGGMTAVSFPTLATGLRPQQHGVLEWGHQLPEDVYSIFDVESVNTGFRNSGRAFDELLSVVGADEQTELSDLNPPFFYLERDNSPHIPYAGFDDLDEYYGTRGDNTHLMRLDYEDAVAESQRLFERRLEELEERGLLEETLVVFTSDHGELFGEYGELGHGTPLCPEIAYVPTVFIHPELATDDFHIDASTEIIEHVDITKISLSAIGHDIRGMAGTDLLTRERERSFGHCFSSMEQRGVQFYLANSLWWHDGGYVFTGNRRTERLAYVLAHAYKSNRRHLLRRHLCYVLRHYWAADHVYGKPPVEKPQACELMNEMLKQLPERDSVQVNLSSDAKETLRNLGYHPD